jgi:hypothetical protein
MTCISAIGNKYAGRPAVVMGGAPSMPAAVAQCPADAVYISANQHGAMLRKCDFVVCVDQRHQVLGIPMRLMLQRYGYPIVGMHEGCDYVMPWRYDGNSGLHAILFACLLGCSPVIATGIEMFKGKTYFHDPDAKSSGFTKPEEFVERVLAELEGLVAGCDVQQVDCNLPFPKYGEVVGYPTVGRPEWMRDIMGF